MRVALDTNRLFAAHTGATTYLLDLLPKLLETGRAGDEVVVLYSWRGALPDSMEWLRRHQNFASRLAPFSGNGNDLWRRIRFPAIESCGFDDFDVCHTIGVSPLPSKTTKRIVSLQGLQGSLSKRQIKQFKKSLRKVDTVVVPSERLKQNLTETTGLESERVEVIHPGVHHRYLEAPKPSAVEELCRVFPFLQEPYLLTLGGSAEAESSVPFLIQSWQGAQKLVSDLPPLVVLARKGEAETVVRLIDNNDLAGDLFVLEDLDSEALPALYRGAEFVLEPTNRGAFGQSVLEAAACGVPAIAHRGCGALEIVGDGARVPDAEDTGPGSGILDLRADKNLWGNEIAEMHRDTLLREELGRMAHQAAAVWTWEAAARRHWQVYGS